MTTPHDPYDRGGSEYPPDPFSPSQTSVTPVPPTGVGITPDEPSGSSSSGSTKDMAREQAQQVKDSAADATSQVAGTAKEQAQQVTEDVRYQAKQLAGQTKTEVTSQVTSQRDKAVSGLRSLGDELSSMTESSSQSGMGVQLARQGADLTHRAADFLEQRDPTQLLDEVRDLGRRRPGAFLIGAALAGVAAGRLTKGAMSARSDDSSTQSTTYDDDTAVPAYGGAHVGVQAEPVQADPWSTPTASVPGRAGATTSPSAAGVSDPAPILDEPYGDQAPPAGYSGRPGSFS